MANDRKSTSRAVKKPKESSTQRTLHDVMAFLPSSSPSASQAGSSKGFRPRDLGKSAPATKPVATRTTRSSVAAASSVAASTSSKNGEINELIVPDPPAPIASTKSGATQSSHTPADTNMAADNATLRSPAKILRPRKAASSAPEPPAPSTRRTRPPRQKVSQTKRKHSDLDDESMADSSTVPPRPTSMLDRDGPLTPKDNVPSARSRMTVMRKPSPPKKARMSPPEPAGEVSSSGQTAATGEIILSSQSDERELAPARPVSKDHREVSENVTKWRAQAHSSFAGALAAEDALPNGAREIDASSQLPRLDTSVNSATKHLKTKTSRTLGHGVPHLSSEEDLPSKGAQHPAQSPITPATSAYDLPRSSSPLSELTGATRSPSPVALDTATKTAQILADIRAKYDRSSSPEEMDPVEFKDVLSDSSDEDEGLFFGAEKNAEQPDASTQKSQPAASTSKSKDSHRAEPEQRRYNLRRKSSAQNLPLPPTPESVSPPRNARKSRKKADPLDFLLKEKRTAERRGMGEDALQFAEKAAASASSRQDPEDLDADDLDDEAWADEEAALRIVQGAGSVKSKTSSPAPSGSLDDDRSDGEGNEEIQRVDRKKILGDKGAKAVGEILKKDRQDRQIQAEVDKEKGTLGVSLWETQAADGMDVENSLPHLPPQLTGATEPLVRSLCQCVHDNDDLQLAVLLQSGVLVLLPEEHTVHLLPWLFRVAATNSAVAQAAYNSVLQICSGGNLAGSQIGFQAILDALSSLGAKQELFRDLGWEVQASAASQFIAAEQKSAVTERIVSMIAFLSEHRTVPAIDAPDTGLALLLMALDSAASSELKTDIAVTLEQLCSSVLEGSSPALGQKICARIVNFGRGLDISTQESLVRLLLGGCPHTNLLARWVAHCLLLDTEPPSPEQYRRQPTLEPIIQLLSPPTGSEQPFDIHGNSENAHFYEHLACRVEILGKILTTIDGYVGEEKVLAGRDSSPVKGDADPKGNATEKEKVVSPLEQIRFSLEALHGKIIDTRAAHLDRSRAKAALQQLAIRLHYQRSSCMRSAPRTSKLDAYFRRK